jgi:Zn-dependent M16 (insulinase) family peptidase
MEKRNGFASMIVPRGSWIATQRAASNISVSIARQEKLSGLSQFFFLDDLLKNSKDDYSKIQNKLEEFRKFLLEKTTKKIHISVDQSAWNKIEKTMQNFLSDFDQGDPNQEPISLELHNETMQAIIVPSSVGFVAQAMHGAKFGTKEYTTELILNRLLGTGFLWENIRMKGGAYGAQSMSFATESVYVLSSYRDPLIVATCNAFKEALTFGASGQINDNDVYRALISVIGDAETPLKPGDRGYTQFKRNLIGINNKLRQNLRSKLLDTTASDISSHAKKLLENYNDCFTAVVAGENAIKKAEQESKDFMFKKIKPVL